MLRHRVWLWNPKAVAPSLKATTAYYQDLCQAHILKWN